jgi:hypothetical protein
MRLPVVNDIVTVRLAMYAFLDLAIITSLWLSTTDWRFSFKLTVVVLIIVANAPNLSSAFWNRPVDTPLFFRTQLFHKYLSKSEVALVLPYRDNGNAMLWQAQTNMFFAMAGGMAPPVESEDQYRWPIFAALMKRSWIPDAPQQLKTFLLAHGVDVVIVADWDVATWRPLFNALGMAPIRVDGVWLYRLGADAAAAPGTARLDMRTLFDTERLSALVRAADKYLSDGGVLSSLAMVRALNQHLLPDDELIGPSAPFDATLASRPAVVDPRFVYGTWVSSWSDDRVALGEYVWKPASTPLIAQFRGIASEVYYPFPNRLSRDTQLSAASAYGFLLMIFTREQLARAAKLLETPAAQRAPRRSTSAFLAVPSIRE